MLESEMMTAGIDFFRHHSEYKIVKQEVPFLSRCIDVVLVNNKNEVISIEFKVSKWRHAIEQATNHRLGADRAYICLPKRVITDVLAQAISNAKLGLFLYDPDAENKIYEAIAPPLKSYNLEVFKKLLINNIKKIT